MLRLLRDLQDTKGCLSDITLVISKFIGVKFRNFLGNISNSTFPSWWTKLSDILWGGGKSKYFLPGSGFTGQIFTGNLSRVDSLGQGVFACSLYISLSFQILFSQFGLTGEWFGCTILETDRNISQMLKQLLFLLFSFQMFGPISWFCLNIPC